MQRTLLYDTVQSFLKHFNYLCSLGEMAKLEEWLYLDDQDQWLFFKLFNRTPTLFRRDQIEYVDASKEDHFAASQDLEASLAKLHQLHFVCDVTELLSFENYLYCLRVKDLIELCKINSFSVQTHRKKDLLQNILEYAQSSYEVPIRRSVQVYSLLHKKLFQRCVRQILCNHDGSFQSYTLSEIEQYPRSFAPYQLSSLQAIHSTRYAYFSYLYWKEGLGPYRHPQLQTDSSLQKRFSALRFWIQQQLQNKLFSENILEEIRPLLSLDIQLKGWIELIQQITLFLHRSGRSSEARTVLLSQYHQREALYEKIILHRTGQQISTKLKKGFPPLPSPHSAFERNLQWTTSNNKHGRRTFDSIVIEPAIVRLLESHHRKAILTENAPWNALFSLLFLDIMFLPIDGSLPSPTLKAPTDFNSPEFYQQRKAQCDERLTQIICGEQLCIFERMLEYFPKKPDQYDITGCNWSHQTLNSLREFLQYVPENVLHCIFKGKLLYPLNAHRGLPDLCIFEGESTRVNGLFPSQLPATFTLVEVKSANDQLSPYQIQWIHLLKQAKCTVELWKITN